jgi:hypothetical protein
MVTVDQEPTERGRLMSRRRGSRLNYNNLTINNLQELNRVSLEGIARIDRPAAQATLEPFGPLGRGTVRE